MGLFATPVLVADDVLGSGDTSRLLGAPAMTGTGANSPYGAVSVDTHVLDHPALGSVRSAIEAAAFTLASQVMGHAVAGMQITQSWVSHKAPGQGHRAHTHHNSLLSGTWFFDASYAEQPALMFHRNVAAAPNWPTLQVPRRSDARSAFAWQRVPVQAKPGRLVLFPAWLQHSVPPNTSERVRKSLAFNLVPTGGLGDERGLTELLFARVS